MRKLIVAALTCCSLFSAQTATAHDVTVRWPHEGRLAFDGGTYVQADYLWHRVPGVFESNDGFLELDLNMPNTYYTSCTIWTSLPNPYSDCETGGWFEGYAPGSSDQYVALGAGSWFPDRIVPNTWYQTRYTLTSKQGTGTGTLPVNFGFQETYRYFCPEMSVWCLNGWSGGRVHQGVPWRDGAPARSSWLTPVGQTVPRDYRCDVYTNTACQ
jgi:hypothetical protein